MKKPFKTWLLVEAALDENDVPYLVADPRAPSRRVGIKRREWPRDPAAPEHPGKPPEHLDHFAERFVSFAHVVDASGPGHLAHYRKEQTAKTLLIHGQCQARDEAEALTLLAPAPPASSAAPASPSPGSPPASSTSKPTGAAPAARAE